jgi:hypothetical protein
MTKASKGRRKSIEPTTEFAATLRVFEQDSCRFQAFERCVALPGLLARFMIPGLAPLAKLFCPSGAIDRA